MGKERPGWLIRLAAEITKRSAGGPNEISYRRLSIAAGLGPNYVSQLLSDDWKEPSFGNVIKLCDYLGLSITYVVTGADVTQREEELLHQMALLDDQERQQLLGLLRAFRRDRAPSQ